MKKFFNMYDHGTGISCESLEQAREIANSGILGVLEVDIKAGKAAFHKEEKYYINIFTLPSVSVSSEVEGSLNQAKARENFFSAYLHTIVLDSKGNYLETIKHEI